MTELRTRARGVTLPKISYGTSGLGGMPDTYGYDVDEARAIATIQAVLALPDGMLDTSRLYGMGRSEERIGKAVAELGGWPEGRLISTKLDRDPETGRFDGDMARRSLEESLTALGLDRVDMLHLHDPEYATDLDEVTRKGGALDTLIAMRDEGLARVVGLAAGRVDVMMPLLTEWDFDCLVTHNRMTLVNRNAEPMLELAAERGIAVLNAAPYAGGMLAKGASKARYVYQEPTDEMRAPVVRVEEACARYDVPPGAAALQFSMRDPRIASTVCGVTRPERVQETLAWAAWPIPDALWTELAALPFDTHDPEATRDYKLG
ncbi:D-threo-aldose 1-dehydrogenase [Amaricoccus macauensis]|uniref:D-threo-aldose 1-dehydrogenase n=1 Tax=Amaricoccus macauensis TaxID=57001 RepID=A0A840SXJ5_9RHOB|nr:aldo/keto reductase [Amaricoccus macauensis]MBB5223802.1 D-threo-aldose 1-dehydrogenase [Amaricoccus macauensis]